MAKFSEQDGSHGARSTSKVVGIDSHQLNSESSPSLDMLDYVADMLLELKTLAESTRCETLTGLIELAAREARLRHCSQK